MRLFNSDRFTKPGKGVDKNAKPKPPFIRFFIVLWNKLSKLSGINFIYFLTCIIMIAIAGAAFAGVVALYDSFDTSVNVGQVISENPAARDIYYKAILFFVIFFTSIPVFSSGPFYAGFTFIIKSFYKEEPVFLWHDFITKTRSNLGLGLKVMIINLVCALIIMLNTAAYMVIANPSNPTYSGYFPWFVLFLIALVTIFLTVLLVMLNLFLYPMMVTFNVTLKQLYKNSFVLCMVKWLPSLGMILLDALLVAVPVIFLPTYNYIVFVALLVLYAAILPGFIGLINMFYVYPVFKKYMIDNAAADKNNRAHGGGEQEQLPDNKPSGGRFENGMWVE
ncbi:MAG: hypothetical protein ILO53_06050 [Clostridia bacterium]|nr:hypothetical protein [Clostridia bacterium]